MGRVKRCDLGKKYVTRGWRWGFKVSKTLYHFQFAFRVTLACSFGCEL